MYCLGTPAPSASEGFEGAQGPGVLGFRVFGLWASSLDPKCQDPLAWDPGMLGR